MISSDFVTAMSRPVVPSIPQATLLNAFKLFDENEKNPVGRVPLPNLIKAMSTLGEESKRMSPEEAEDLILQVVPSIEETGYLDYVSYLNVMFSK